MCVRNMTWDVKQHKLWSDRIVKKNWVGKRKLVILQEDGNVNSIKIPN